MRLSLVGKGCEALTLLALLLLVPRVLGAGDYGAFAVVLSLVALGSSALSLGGPTLATRFVPDVPVERRAAFARALLARLARVRFAQVVACAVAGGIAATTVPEHFPAVLVVLAVAALALDVAATLAFQIGLALGRTGRWSFRFPLQNSVLVASAVALHGAFGRTGAIAAIPLASASALLLGAIGLPRLLERGGERAVVPPDVIRFGVLQALAGFCQQFVHRGPVLAVLLLTFSAVETGYTALAAGIALAGTFALWQPFVVTLPEVVGRYRDDAAEIEAAARRLGWRLEAVAIPLALASALALPPLLPILVGGEYSGGAAALAPALATLPLGVLAALTAQIAALRVAARERLGTLAAGALAFALAALVLVPGWGSTGGTLAMLIGTAVVVVSTPLLLPGTLGRGLPAVALAGSALVAAIGLLE